MDFEHRRLGYIVRPYKNEILYSMIARMLSHTLERTMFDSLTKLVGRGNYVATIDLPAHLEQLYNSCFHKVLPSVDCLIELHTLYSFYSPFLRADKRERIISRMKSGKGSTIHVIAGINSGGQRIRFPKFCPLCIAEMREQYGEAYWKREHQIPWMRVCTVHSVFLEVYVPKTSELSHSKFFAAESIRDHAQKVIVNKNNNLLMICRSLEDMLYQKSDFDINTASYKNKFANNYLIGKRFNFARLIDDLYKFYGQKCLEFYFPTQPQTLAWVPLVVRRPLMYFSPIRHVLLQKFINEQGTQLTLFGNHVAPAIQFNCINSICKRYRLEVTDSIKTYYDSSVRRTVSIVSCECGMKYKAGPAGNLKAGFKVYTIQEYGSLWKNKVLEEKGKGKSIAAIAKMMHTGWRAVDRFLKEADRKKPRDLEFQNTLMKNRTEWETLLNSFEHPKISSARRAKGGLYRWLYNHDLSWLKVINSLHATRSKPPQLRLDWEQIDSLLVSKISLAAEQLKEQNYKGRITRTLISKIINKEKNYMVINASKIPMAIAKLKQVTESIEDSQKRRSLVAIDQLSNEGQSLTVNKVMRTAKFINPTDKVVALIVEEIYKRQLA